MSPSELNWKQNPTEKEKVKIRSIHSHSEPCNILLLSVQISFDILDAKVRPQNSEGII